MFFSCYEKEVEAIPLEENIRRDTIKKELSKIYNLDTVYPKDNKDTIYERIVK